MLGFISTLFRNTPKPKKSYRRPARRGFNAVDVLEDRRLMTANVAVNYSTGDLEIVADYRGEKVTVTSERDALGNDFYRVSTGYVTKVDYVFPKSYVWGGDILFIGGDGPDIFENTTGLGTTAYGYGGNDRLVGSFGSDFLDGGLGYDVLIGGAGNDTLYAGWDYYGSYMNGGDGIDTMIGSYGRDEMWGGNHNDYMYGYDGDDFLYGEGGNDYMFGNNGRDYLDGGLGYDELYGGNDSDSLNGGDDGVADRMVGGAGYDYFQQDWAWKRNAYYGYYYEYNRDMPVDYESGEGFYNF